MIIKKPGKYKLTQDYDQPRGSWAIAVIPHGTIIEITNVSLHPLQSTNEKIYQVYSHILGWTSDDLPLEEIKE